MDRPVFDYSKLYGRIREKVGTQKKFAKLMNLSATSISLKLNNRSYFDQSEIQRAAKVLDIEPGSVSSYFFAQKL